ncbi:hypothetical protein GCM10023067_56340 [Aminobacter aganoensis]
MSASGGEASLAVYGRDAVTCKTSDVRSQYSQSALMRWMSLFRLAAIVAGLEL